MSAFRSLSIPVNLVRLATVFFFIEFVRGAILISYIQKYAVDELYLTLTAVGVAVTAHYVADTVSKLGVGVLLDRLPMQWILQASFAVSFIGLILLQYSVYAWLLVLGAAVFGIGFSPIWIIGMSSVSERERGHQMGVLYMAWMLGLGLGPVLMNFFLDWFGYYISFTILLGMTVAAWVVSWLIPNSHVHTHSVPMSEQFGALWERLRDMRPLLPGMILQTLGASMLIPILPTFAGDQLQLTNSQYSFFLLTGGGFAVAGLIPMGKLSDKLGKKWFLVLGFALFAFGLYSITTVDTLWIAFLWAIVLGLSYAAVLPAWNALLAAFVPPKQKGIGWGIFSTVEGIGVMIGPAVGGLLADSFGLSLPFLISASMFLFIGLFYMWFPLRVFR
ncbi:MFS transporter [Paenibacillus alkalitolerans]|uniref:MFS transporter n=1 Tax=Paenibacillus alkalitolerans TaxID=2799335 RepID=UPI0018F3418E|nr:MFS transporter [Paenibacillus alkalitolerans]